MRGTRRTPRPQNEPPRERTEELTDIEVAKKMIKIYQSAQDRRLEFNLSFESVKRLLQFPTCYYTNRIFEEDGLYARSFDRIDSSRGYVEGNVVACTVDINGKKSNLSVDEIDCLYNKLVRTPKAPRKPSNSTETTPSLSPSAEDI